MDNTLHNNDELLLSAKGVAKNFGPIHALKSVDFNLKAGEVHALFGANGAGKSTLAKIICGHQTLSAGELFVSGKATAFTRPRDAIEAGIGIVMQETSLADELPVWENIILPYYGSKEKIPASELRAKAEAAIHRLGFADDVSLDQPTFQLSSAQRQIVEIARIVALGSRIIILDEPTAALSPSESARLFSVMDSLRDDGHGLIFVSHRLEEIFAMTDRITVLRDGVSVGSDIPTSELDQASLVQLMVGRAVESLQAGEIPYTAENPVLLHLNEVRAAPFVKNVTLNVHQGEIVGLGGLVGAGRSELAEAIMGVRRLDTGAIKVLGEPYMPTTPAAAGAAGLGFLPEDRRRQSIIPDFSVRENILLTHLSQGSGQKLRYADRRDRIAEIADLIELPRDRLDESSLFNFSGGMQQKALIIRSLLMNPKVLILDEPTKGVDIGSRATIYSLLRKLAADGMAILLISSDFEELLALSHRIVPISDGRTIGSVPASSIDEEQLTLMCAPRSSLGRQEVLLSNIAAHFEVQAAWLIRAGARVLCLARQGHVIAPNLPEPGSVQPDGETSIPMALAAGSSEVFIEEDDHQSVVLKIENQRGHSVGLIALAGKTHARPMKYDEVVEFVSKSLSEFEEGQLRVTSSSDTKSSQGLDA